ncbi:MAG: tetratricopeptide repeat protein [Candidatus Margulisiibacteriota bacterium]
MEVLKKVSSIGIVGILMSQVVFASLPEGIMGAFEKSYSLEYAGLLNKAVEAVKPYADKSYEANIRLAYLAKISGQVPEAIASYEKAISLQKNSLEARLLLVDAQASLGNWDKVASAYLDILKIEPDNAVVNYRLGLLYYNREDYKNAVKVLEKAYSLYPMDLETLSLYGWTQLKLGKTAEAKDLFNTLLMLSPKNVSALEGLRQSSN